MKRLIISASVACLLVSACEENKPTQKTITKPATKKPASKPSKAAASAPAKSHGGHAMPTSTGSMIMAQTVADFDKWKAAFDANADKRKGMGVVWHSVSRSPTEKKMVLVHLIGDLGKMKGFQASPGFKKAMQAAGVEGDPAVWWGQDVAIKSPRGALKEKTASMFVRHKVADFNAWKAAFDGGTAARGKTGMVGTSISKDPKDPNTVIVHTMGSTSMALFKYAQSEGFKKSLKASGVTGEIDILIGDDVEVKSYH